MKEDEKAMTQGVLRHSANDFVPVKCGEVRCRLCDKNALEIGGYLGRVEDGWECRPSCAVEMSNGERVMAAILGGK